MARPSIEIIGKEKVLAFFENEDGTEWKIFREYNTEKKDCFVKSYIGEDKDEAYQKLFAYLTAIEDDNNNSYTLVIDNGEDISKIFFKLNPGNVTKHIAGINQTATDPTLLALLNKQQEQLNELTSRFNAEDSEEEEEEKSGIMGLIDHQIYGPLIATAITGIVNKLMPAAPTALAGVPSEQDEKINQAIIILKNYDNNLGDHLLKLADIAQNNNSQFNMLLKML